MTMMTMMMMTMIDGDDDDDGDDEDDDDDDRALMIPVDFQIWMVGKLETTKQGGFDGQSRSEKNKSKASTRICIPGGMWSVTMPEPPAMYKVHLTGWSCPASRHGHQEQIGI